MSIFPDSSRNSPLGSSPRRSRATVPVNAVSPTVTASGDSATRPSLISPRKEKSRTSKSTASARAMRTSRRVSRRWVFDGSKRMSIRLACCVGAAASTGRACALRSSMSPEPVPGESSVRSTPVTSRVPPVPGSGILKRPPSNDTASADTRIICRSVDPWVVIFNVLLSMLDSALPKMSSQARSSPISAFSVASRNSPIGVCSRRSSATTPVNAVPPTVTERGDSATRPSLTSPRNEKSRTFSLSPETLAMPTSSRASRRRRPEGKIGMSMSSAMGRSSSGSACFGAGASPSCRAMASPSGSWNRMFTPLISAARLVC